MLSRKFIDHYISFITVLLTVFIIGPIYYFVTKYLANFVSEKYQQTVAVTLGVIAVAIAFQMMTTIEGNKDEVIEDTEKMIERFLRSKNRGE